MIILKIQGGLGNQMFQYAFGRNVQEQTNQKLILDISDFAYDSQREYSLLHFRLNDDVILDSSGCYNKVYDQRKNLFLKIGTKLFPEFQYNYFSKRGIYIWDYVKYKNIRINNSFENLYLHGFWQGYEYMSEILDRIPNEFQVIEPINPINKDLYNKILNFNSVCVHIRRGDFLSKTNKLYVSSNEYYINAMKTLEKKYNNLVFFIFSDDIEDVKKNFIFKSNNVIYVESNNPDYEELRLMYSCNHFIISNSTFSWWAANLSTRKNKTIIAPQNWYTDGRDMSHLIGKDWILLLN